MSDTPDKPTPDPMPAREWAELLAAMPVEGLDQVQHALDRERQARIDALRAQLDALTGMASANGASEAAQSASKASRSVTKGRVAARPKKRANRRSRSKQNRWTPEREAEFIELYLSDGSKAAAERFGMARTSASQKMHALRKAGKAPAAS